MAAVPVAAQTAPHYRITHKVVLGTPDRWDYITYDAGAGRVFVSHGDRVDVVDGRDGRILGNIAGYAGGTHGIALSAATGHGYTDDGRAGEAGSFDLRTLAPIRRIPAGADADAIAIDPKTGHVFIVNGDSGTLTVIDPVHDRAIGTIEIGGKLEFAVADGAGSLFVNNAERSEIDRIHTATGAVDARWPIPSCSRPHGLAIDPATRRLFSSCVNRLLVVVDADTGRVVSSVPIGEGTDAAAFDPKRRLVFSANGVDGTLSVIQERDAGTFVPLEDVPTAVTARTMALDPASGRIYVVAGEAVGPPGPGHRAIVPGSVALLFIDPAD